jgi:hypothetical protein
MAQKQTLIYQELRLLEDITANYGGPPREHQEHSDWTEAIDHHGIGGLADQAGLSILMDLSRPERTASDDDRRY